MMRDQYAQQETETYVELEFYTGDRHGARAETRTIRLRKHWKTAKSGSRVPHSVELTMPDGTVFPEKKNATDAKIIGNTGAYCRSVSTDRDDRIRRFFKALYTKSDERKMIFPNYSGQTSIGRSRKILEENPWRWMSASRRTTVHLSRRKAVIILLPESEELPLDELCGAFAGTVKRCVKRTESPGRMWRN